MDGIDVVNANTGACVREVIAHTIKVKDDIESAVIEGSDILNANTEACVQELIAHTLKGKEDIETTVTALVDVAKREIQDSKTKKDDKDYESQYKGKHACIYYA
ncbi:hypothetical protein DPMN_192273 [Dreissena polymorpha]|uniref:Uncharacterized protein n=1 Tax=Dreissena polymorpha TaxID=45954 RepID=A0A9D3Y182_DREPO|nr:hypothetical protein DPMN_192273 [Dreissena polymorpha]